MNNKGYEYQIVMDSEGVFVEVYETDEQGKKGEMHLSIFVNSKAGETVREAIAATEVELFDPMYVNDADETPEELARQREAFQWVKESYCSINGRDII